MRRCFVHGFALAGSLFGQQPPYDVFPPADPADYRVRHEASKQLGGLAFPVHDTIWIPPSTGSLRGVIVHQHGCGEGSRKSGLTGAFDLLWQALAREHSDTPPQPLAQMRFIDGKTKADERHRYRVIAVDTVGLKSN